MTATFPRQQLRHTLLGILALVVGFYLTGAVALAAEVPNAPPFAKGVPEHFGCLVCHADPKYKKDPVKKGIYLEKNVIMKSSHKDLPCTSCHANYTTPPAEAHEEESERSAETFAKTAKASCASCKDHTGQAAKLAASAHGKIGAVSAGGKQPGCVDCHGPHDIRNPKKDKTWGERFHLSGKDVCGQCHTDEYKNYDDYYHGRAYKMRAEDSPSCWNCHGTHEIFASAHAKSATSKKSLVKTCGTCHRDSSESFTEFSALIHGRQKMNEANPLWKYINMVLGYFIKDKATAESEEEIYDAYFGQ